MDMQWLFWVMLFILFIWSLYMATFRPDEYNKLSNDTLNRAGRLCGGAFRFAGFCLRNYKRFK